MSLLLCYLMARILIETFARNIRTKEVSASILNFSKHVVMSLKSKLGNPRCRCNWDC